MSGDYDDEVREASAVGGETMASIQVGRISKQLFRDAVERVLEQSGGAHGKTDLLYSAMEISGVKHSAARHYLESMLSSAGDFEVFQDGQRRMVRRKNTRRGVGGRRTFPIRQEPAERRNGKH